MKCPLCNTRLINKIDEVYYDCSTCRAVVKEDRFCPGPEEEQARYLKHNNNIDDPGYRQFTSPIINYILENFDQEHQGLDFGAGPGPVISAVLQEHEYDINQYDPYFAPYEELLKCQYDYIISCEVVEHFHEPEKEFSRLSKMLKFGGVLACMTHLYDDEIEFEGWYYRKDPTHVFIYRAATFDYIKRMFQFSSCHIDGRLIVLKK